MPGSAWDSIPKPKPAKKVEGKPLPRKATQKPSDPQKSLRGVSTPSEAAEVAESSPVSKETVPEPKETFLLTGAKTRREQEEDKHIKAASQAEPGYMTTTPRFLETTATFNQGKIPGLAGSKKMTVDDSFIEVLQGKEFVLYPGLLDLAHRMGFESMKTEIVQLPTTENGQYAVVRATAVVDGRTFQGIGDASPASVTMKTMTPHLLRLAETRAKARALRDACNIGATAKEELGDVE